MEAHASLDAWVMSKITSSLFTMINISMCINFLT
jgi:hypothetical protein